MILNHVDGGFRAECDISQDKAVRLRFITVGTRIYSEEVVQRSGPVPSCWRQIAGITLFPQNGFAW